MFFRLDDAAKPKAVDLLKQGLARTLSQARHLCSTIEKDEGGGHSYVRKKNTTVEFHVQWLDAPEDKDKYPSFEDIEKTSFSAVSLGDLKLWSVHPMTYGEKPEANPDCSPKTAAFKANFVRGGLVFNMHHHHYANDLLGWAGFTHQLAENCNAILNNSAFPPWDPACLDLSRLTKQEPPEDQKVDGPPAPERHPDQEEGIFLFFHLPKSKAAELKKLATPTDSDPVPWISTYDAFCAFIWRTFTRLRAPVFNTNMASKPFWVEGVDMRRRLHSPKVPARTQGNVMSGAFSDTAPFPAPTVAEVASEWPLSKLACYIRQLTSSVTQEALDGMLGVVATVRDKAALNIRIDSKPPMAVLMTDHRDANIPAADFGFARPVTYRHLLDAVTTGVNIVYPSRDPSPESDEGCEFTLSYERRLMDGLIADEEFKKYFEYRGIDAMDANYVKSDELKN